MSSKSIMKVFSAFHNCCLQPLDLDDDRVFTLLLLCVVIFTQEWRDLPVKGDCERQISEKDFMLMLFALSTESRDV